MGLRGSAPDPKRTPRPPPPPDPGTGLSIVVPDPATREHPLLNGRPNPKEIALTFDAGADPGYASDILDLFRDEGYAFVTVEEMLQP